MGDQQNNPVKTTKIPNNPDPKLTSTTTRGAGKTNKENR